MVGVSISAAFFFWLGKARMIEKSILGLGLDVGRHIFIDWQKRRSYGIGRYFFFLFSSFRFSSVDGVTACGVFTRYLHSSSYYVYT